MRIEGCYSSSLVRPMQVSAALGQTASTRSQSSPALSLSQTGSLMMSAQQAYRDLPAVRENQVRRMNDLISSGNYTVNANAIATGMLGSTEGATAGE